MEQFKVVQPSDLGPQFTFNQTTGLWSVSGTGVSGNAGNILVNGTDGAPLLTPAAVQSNQLKYTFAYNATMSQINLLDSTGAVVSSINPQVFQGTLDQVTVSNSQVTFTDATDSTTLQVNFANFLTAIATANSTSMTLSGNGTAATPLTASVIIDPDVPGNLLQVSATGLSVSPSNVLALLNAATTTVSASSVVNTLTVEVNGQSSTATIINSNTLTIDATSGNVVSNLNGVAANLPAVELLNSSGNHIAYAIQ